MLIEEVGMVKISSFFLVGCNSGRVLGFGVLGSRLCVCVFLFSFFFFFCCDRCLKEEVGMADIGGFLRWRLVVFWVWIGAMCGASSVALMVAPMVGFWLSLN